MITSAKDFQGRAKRLDAVDFGRMGKMIGVGEDKIRAVVDVECAGSGFDAKGRPKMLFEPHKFWQELGDVKRRVAQGKGLAYRRWTAAPYPVDSYPRLLMAMEIDRAGALRSASWGLGQILGSNHKAAGFASVDDMIAAFVEDEETHLQAMINFILAESLDDDLRRGDWSGFARGYNGAGYATHGYHTKLAVAYAKWQARPDAA